MNNNLTRTSTQVVAVKDDVSLLEMRRDSKTYPRLKTYSREAAVFEMSKIVSTAFLFRGQAADAMNIQFISCNLVDELRADLDHIGTGNICFGEISRIVKRAILTEDMFGISVSSLYKVISNYIKGEGHALQKQLMGR